MREGSGAEPPEQAERPEGSSAQEPVPEAAAAGPETNFLADPGFEEDSGAWALTDLKATQELYIEDKPQDSLSGTKHAHFWSPAPDSVEFTMEQTVSGLSEGRFRFSLSVMGGDCGQTDIYAYVKVDGQETARSEQIPVTEWKDWHRGTVPEFDHPAGTDVTVGIYVKCEGAGNGAWGKIDDAELVPVP